MQFPFVLAVAVRRRSRGNTTLRVTTLLALLGMAFSSLAHAGGKAKPKEPFKPPYDKIDSVDTAAKTITVSHVNSTNHEVKVLRLTDITEVEVNGIDMPKGDITKLHAGMRVDASVGMDPAVAGRVVASELK